MVRFTGGSWKKFKGATRQDDVELYVYGYLLSIGDARKNVINTAPIPPPNQRIRASPTKPVSHAAAKPLVEPCPKTRQHTTVNNDLEKLTEAFDNMGLGGPAGAADHPKVFIAAHRSGDGRSVELYYGKGTAVEEHLIKKRKKSHIGAILKGAVIALNKAGGNVAIYAGGEGHLKDSKRRFHRESTFFIETLTLSTIMSGRGLRQQKQSIQDPSRLPDAFVERTLSLCKNHERIFTDVHSICITMFENKKNICSRGHSKIEQRTAFRNGFFNRRCRFNIVIFGLVGAVF